MLIWWISCFFFIYTQSDCRTIFHTIQIFVLNHLHRMRKKEKEWMICSQTELYDKIDRHYVVLFILHSKYRIIHAGFVNCSCHTQILDFILCVCFAVNLMEISCKKYSALSLSISLCRIVFFYFILAFLSDEISDCLFVCMYELIRWRLQFTDIMF